jgi:glutaredoxin 3
MAQVTVYSTTTCKYCKEVKEYLTTHNIAYEEVLLDETPDRIPELLEISGQRGVPVTKIVKDDGTAVGILGWDEEQMAAQLGLGPVAAQAA